MRGLKMQQETNNVTWRMYGLVPYNVSEIQAGIQFGHAVVEYGLEHFNDKDYQEWANNHKTFIILNGGTHSTMLGHITTLRENGIKSSTFEEPDLNNMLSGIVFLVDSRVYDRENYPDYYDYCRKIRGNQLVTDDFKKEWLEYSKELGSEDYKEWVKFMGGEKNVFLREFLTKFKLR